MILKNHFETAPSGLYYEMVRLQILARTVTGGVPAGTPFIFGIYNYSISRICLRLEKISASVSTCATSFLSACSFSSAACFSLCNC